MNPTLDALVFETDGRGDRRRAAPSGALLPDRRRPAGARGGAHGRLDPAGERPVRAVPARVAAARAGRHRAVDRRRGAPGADGLDGRARRWARPVPPSTTAARSCARTSRTTRTTRRASSGSPRGPAPPAPRDPAGRSRPRSSSGAPAPAGPGWLVSCLAEFAARDVNLTRIESRPLRQRLGRVHVLPRPRGLDRPTQRSPTPSPDCVRTRTSYVCSGRFQRPETPGLMATLAVKR